jgi:hypothetical protein
MYLSNKGLRISQMGNREKLATYGTQEEDKQNKVTTQYV